MPGKEVVFDSDGDTRLSVGAGHSLAAPAVFTVCSRALSRASPVFDNIFHGDGDCDGKPPGDLQRSEDHRIVELPHDDPASLALLLYAVHARFDQVPRRLSTVALHGLAAVAHKYGATAVLRPWTAAWTRSIAAELDGGSGALLLKAMSICWVLGCREGFFRATAMFVERVPELTAADLGDLQIPPDTIEYILSIRIETIELLCNVFRDMIQNLLVVDEGPRWCRHATWFGHHRCESMILGSLMSGLSRAELWPLPDAADVKYSVLDLRTRFEGVEVQDIGRAGEEDDDVDHCGCNPSQHLRDATKEVIEDIARRLSSIMFKTGQLDLSK